MTQQSIAILRVETRWRMRQRWHRAEKSLILQAKAICRSHTAGDKDAANALFDQISGGANDVDMNLTTALMPFLSAIANFQELRKPLEKELALLARDLPAAEWIKATPGIALPSLAAIVGEAGDLANYSTHSKLWKRMGMAPFKKNGITRSGKQWKIEGGLTADDWKEFGYKSTRRSVMFVIEDSMTKAQGPYREIYLARKQYLRDRAMRNGLTVAPAAKIPDKHRDQFISDGHIDQDAKRYMGKRLLRDLWRTWRRARQAVPEGAAVELPAAENSNGEATVAVPAKAEFQLPPSTGAMPPLPKGHDVGAPVTNSLATEPVSKGHGRIASEAQASDRLPKGPARHACATNSLASPPLPKGRVRRAGETPASHGMPKGHLTIAGASDSLAKLKLSKDHQSSASEAPASASMPKGHDASAGAKNSLAIDAVPKGQRPIASEAPTSSRAPKGRGSSVGAKNSDAPQGAGEADQVVPAKARRRLPPRQSPEAAE
jgi:hypothetical protein